MESEKEKLTASPINDYISHPRRGGVVIQAQKSKSSNFSSLSITDSGLRKHKAYDSDDENKSEEDSNSFKNHRRSKHRLNIIKLRHLHKYELDTDEIGGSRECRGVSINEVHDINEINNIVNKLGGKQSSADSDSTYNASDSEIETKPTKERQTNQKRQHRIDYALFQWIFVILFTVITVVDRFTINLWPLWVDSPGPTVANNFSVSVFSLIAWISSRMLIVSSSYLFLFQCNVFWNWIVELPFVNRYIAIGDIHAENITLHYHVGWLFCGLPVLLHVWSVIFAAAFPPNSLQVYNSWMRPDDPNTGNPIPFYSNYLLSLALNDVYRIISTSISFLVLIPYSVVNSCRRRGWSFAQWMHLFGATIYTVDLLRMYSHPHCWIFNTPFILWWIFDRLYGIFYYRRCVANIVKKIHLDNDYMILYLRIPNHLYNKRNIGDVFYFNQLKCNWDRAHPFTVFWNHKNMNQMLINPKQQLLPNWSGHKFRIYNYNNDYSQSQSKSQYIMSRKSSKSVVSDISKNIVSFDKIMNEYDNEEENIIPFDYDWNVGIIVQIVPDHTKCYYRKTWTNEIFNSDIRFLCGLRGFGPYRSEYRLLTDTTLPLILIGTGAGSAMLIDFYNYITNNNITLQNKCVFYFSTRSIAMFQWFTDITCHTHVDNLSVNAHLTSRSKIIFDKNKKKNCNKERDSNIGRLNIDDILNSDTNTNTDVYFCGSPSVQMMVANLCKKLSLTFHAGHSF